MKKFKNVVLESNHIGANNPRKSDPVEMNKHINGYISVSPKVPPIPLIK